MRTLFLSANTPWLRGTLCALLLLSLSHTSSAVTERRAANDLFTVAQRSFDDKLYLSASKKFDEFLQRFSNSGQVERAHLLLGQSLFHLKNWQRSAHHFKKVIEKDGADLALGHFWLGRTYYELGEYRRAEKEFDEAKDDFTDSPAEAKLLFSIAMSQFKSGDFVRAASSFAVMIKKYPDNPETAMAAMKIPECAYRRKKYEEAITGFKQYLESYRHSRHIPQVLYYLAESHYNTFAWQKSVDTYKKILEHKNTTARQRANALYSLGWAEDKNNNLKESLKYFSRFKETGHTRTRKDKPESSLTPLVNFKIGEIHFKLGNYQKAQPYFATLQSHPVYGMRATAWQAEALYFQGEYRQAQKFYDRLLQEKDSELYPEALQGKGRCLMNVGDYAAATLLFQEAIEKSTTISEIVESRRALAQISRLRGRLDKAIAQVKSILEEYGQKIPRDEFLLYLGTLHFDKRQYDEAQENYRAVIADFPLKETAIKARQSLGDLKRAQGRFDLAAGIYAKIATMTQASALQKESALYYQGLSLYNSHDYHGAQDIFSAALSSYPRGRLYFEFRRNIANCLIAKENLNEAEEAFKAMVAEFDGSDKLLNLLYDFGMFYYERNQHLKARVEFRRLITEFPEKPLAEEAQYYLGKSAAALNLDNQALQQWRALHRKKGSQFKHLVALDIVELLLQSQRLNEALTSASAFLSEAKDPSQRQELGFLEGKIFFALKDWRNAIKSLQPVADGVKNHNSMQAEILIGDAYINGDKDYENASLHYMNAIYLHSQDEETFIDTSLKLAATFVKLKQYEDATKVIIKAYATKTKVGAPGQMLLDEITVLQSKTR